MMSYDDSYDANQSDDDEPMVLIVLKVITTT